MCGKKVRRYRELTPSALLPRKSNELWSFFGAQPAAHLQGSQELCSVCVPVRESEQAGRDSLSGPAGWDEDQAQDGICSSFRLWFSNWGLRLGGKLTGSRPLKGQPLASQNPQALVHSQDTQPRLGPYISHLIENRNGERWAHCYLLAWGSSEALYLPPGCLLQTTSEKLYRNVRLSEGKDKTGVRVETQVY